MDQAELRMQLDRHHVESYAWALRCCRENQADAEDVLQTVYLKVLDGRARFGGLSSFRTWLFSVIRAQAADVRRYFAIRRRHAELQRREDPGDETPAPEDRALRAERARMLADALRVLPRRQMEVLGLVFYHAYTIKEAAGIMRVSIGSARQHYERGKRRLGELLSEWRRAT
jgi:RNA polymerase sigma-70 factor (ECF subfamily)